MKHKILNRIISLVIAIAVMVGVMPMASISVLAAESKKAGTTVEETQMTPADVVATEVDSRKPITADRSAANVGPYAVYVDGKLHAQGNFSDMWNLAMELAPYAVEDEEHSNAGKKELVEFVLCFDMRYKSDWFGEKTMTVSNKKITIDLNGHLLKRDDKGSVIKVTDHAVLTIMDSNPKRTHYGSLNSNGMWLANNGSSTLIRGGVITGGNCGTGDGGGLYIEEESTVYLQGGTIAGNKADVGSGVYLEDGSTLDMTKGVSQLCYNYCAGTSSDGGTIFLRSDCTVIGGYVHSNVADDYGGGIRAKGGNILIKDVIVYNNKALDYGGGLYIERSGTGQTVTVSGCKIFGNFTGVAGGGMYIYDLYMVKMTDCWVENNTANKEGGGICVSDWTGSDLSISGKIIVRNNYVSQDKTAIKSNLYLEGDEDLIVETISIGSEIWVRTEEEISSYNGLKNPIVTQATDASPLFFYSDVDGYHIEFQNDPKKSNYRYLFFAAGAKEDFDVKLMADYGVNKMESPYKISTGAYKGQTTPLYKGYFEYSLMTTSDYISASPFYYSDGYFFEDPTVYNEHLATMSINMAVAAFGRNTTYVGDNEYANHFANVKQLFADIGCADVNFFANEDYQIKPTYYNEKDRLSTIGVAISQKEISMNGETYTLVPIAIRGGGYESEWSSNVTIGNSGEAAGFSDAANQVYKHVQNYVKDYGLTDQVMNGKVKFWVVGYSRAGATANLTAKRLIDYYTYVGNQVFGYTFEAPMGGVESKKIDMPYTGNGTYPTIHNTVNELDFVTLVAPSEMGFIRYGVDHLVGSDYKNGVTVDSTEYSYRLARMLGQLKAINPYYQFDTKWSVAELSIIYGGLFGNGILDDQIQFWDDPNKECENMYEFLRWFFLIFQEYGLNLPTKEVTVTDSKGNTTKKQVADLDKARENYSTFKPLGSIAGNTQTGTSYSDSNYNFGYSEMTVQDAAAGLVSMLMGDSLTNDQLSEIIGSVKGSAIELAKDAALIGGSILGAITLVNPIITAIITVAVASVGANEIYDLLIDDWDTHSEAKKAEIINMVMHLLLDNRTDGKSVWDVLDEDQAKTIAEGLPVLLWFALNLVSGDNNTGEGDDGMWGIPTFVSNISAITANHYQEVSIAWVRSNDSYYLTYAADRQPYTFDTSKIEATKPTGTYARGTKTFTLSAKAGSSIFYSVDGGNTWSLYTKAVTLENVPDQILCFSIYRGVKSDVADISLNGWAGSLLGNGNIWFLLAGSAFIVGFCVVSVEMSRKKKKETNND